MVKVERFEVYAVELDPTKGSEMKKTRPCVIISPDEMNSLRTVIIAPMTSKGIPLPSRVQLVFQKKMGQVVLDQIRAVDKQRLKKRIGKLSVPVSVTILNTLQEMFDY